MGKTHLTQRPCRLLVITRLLRALEGFHNRQQCAHKFPLRRHDLLTSSDVLLLVRRGLERVLNEVSQLIMDVVHDELTYLREDLRRAEA